MPPAVRGLRCSPGVGACGPVGRPAAGGSGGVRRTPRPGPRTARGRTAGGTHMTTRDDDREVTVALRENAVPQTAPLCAVHPLLSLQWRNLVADHLLRVAYVEPVAGEHRVVPRFPVDRLELA